jgi:predicted RNase H-like nuclease
VNVHDPIALEAAGAGDAVGIDGCRGGWIAVALDAAWRPDWHLARTVDEVLARWPSARCLIDIPIGLPDAVPRAVEREARRRLGRPRASSVFPVPCRAAVYAADYETACRVNREVLGSAISRQAWNILPKVREVDGLIARAPEAKRRLHEAHPELCFHALAGGVPMAHGKKRAEGCGERLALIGRRVPGAAEWIDEVLAHTRRAVLARDDLVDALALAVSARLPLASIPPPGDGGADGPGRSPGDACATMLFPAVALAAPGGA